MYMRDCACWPMSEDALYLRSSFLSPSLAPPALQSLPIGLGSSTLRPNQPRLSAYQDALCPALIRSRPAFVDVSPPPLRTCPGFSTPLPGCSCSSASRDASCPALIRLRPAFVDVSPPPLRTCPGFSTPLPGCSCSSAYRDAVHLKIFSAEPVSACSRSPLFRRGRIRPSILQPTYSHLKAYYPQAYIIL